MATPCDLYIRFLITRGIDSSEEVNARLNELGIQPVSSEIINQHLQTVKKILPASVERQRDEQVYSSDFLTWIKVLEVEELWRFEKEFFLETHRYIRLVYDIHYDVTLRIFLNALLLKGVPPTDICRHLNSRFSCMLKEESVAAYRKFFWNSQRMTRRDWTTFLRGCNERETSLYFIALSEPLDVLLAELELPAKVSVSDSLQYLLSKSFAKAKEYLRLSTKEANSEARAWINQVVVLADKYEKYRAGDANDFSKVLQMEFEFTDTTFPTPDAATLRDLKDRKNEKTTKEV